MQRAMIKDYLKKHEGVQMILEKLKDDLAEMDLILLTQRPDKLPDRERSLILDRKALYLWFLGFFADTAKITQDIADKVKEETEHFEENKSNYSL